jgi:hypothetical protein
MIEDMAICKFAEKTQHDYVQRVKDFATFLGRSPRTAESEKVRRSPAPANLPPRPRHADDDTTSADDEPKMLASPCPCCGGRMTIIETFRRGTTPRYRPAALCRMRRSIRDTRLASGLASMLLSHAGPGYERPARTRPPGYKRPACTRRPGIAPVCSPSSKIGVPATTVAR